MIDRGTRRKKRRNARAAGGRLVEKPFATVDPRQLFLERPTRREEAGGEHAVDWNQRQR